MQGGSPVSFLPVGFSHSRDEATRFLFGHPPGGGWGHPDASLPGGLSPSHACRDS